MGICLGMSPAGRLEKGKGWGLLVERFERCGVVEGLGVLRFAQEASGLRLAGAMFRFA